MGMARVWVRMGSNCGIPVLQEGAGRLPVMLGELWCLGVAWGWPWALLAAGSCEEEGGISRPFSSSSGCLRRLLLPTEAPPLVFWFPAKHRSSVGSSCCQSEL